VSSRTRKILKDYRNNTKESDEAGNDHAYIIESIMDIQENEDGDKMYMVKWFNFPEEAATLESEGNIPQFIVEYYKDKSKMPKNKAHKEDDIRDIVSLSDLGW
jgi:hypothetical protein